MLSMLSHMRVKKHHAVKVLGKAVIDVLVRRAEAQTRRGEQGPMLTRMRSPTPHEL